MKLIRSNESRCVDVTYWDRGNPVSANACASLMDDVWWINRVVVHKDLRGKGIGKTIVEAMLKMIAERGPATVQVCPGGYDMKFSAQCAFYEACGFEHVLDGLYARRV